MKLDVLLNENRFIVSSGRPDVPLKYPPLMFGDTVPLELRAWERNFNGALRAVDISSYEITLLVGPPNTRPTLGFWQITSTAGTSGPIAARAPAEDVTTALTNCFGPVTVKGNAGSYIVTLEQTGVWELPTSSFQGNTLTGVLVFQITAGTTETPAQYRFEILEVAPGRVVPASWSVGDTSPTNTFIQVSGRLWQLTIDPAADAGFFTLVVDGVTTEFISLSAVEYDIKTALVAAGKPAEVQPDGIGGFYVNFSQTTTACSVSGNTVILPYMTSALGLTGSGIRELLDGAQFSPVKLSVLLTKDGKVETVATADMLIEMPVNQPAIIAIDAPEMAGLTFSINSDQSQMLVYQNGILLYSVLLNTPIP